MLNIPDMKILWLTDSHLNLISLLAASVFGDANPITGIGKRYVLNTITAIQSAADKAVADGVDVVVITGDNINGGSDADRILKAQAFVAVFNALGIPVVCCFGHWDTGSLNPDAAEFAQLYDNTGGFGTLMPTPVSTWTANIAGVAAGTPHAYTYELNNYVFVSLWSTTLNSNINMTTGDSGAQTQNQWFAARLAEVEASGKQAIILIHRPLISGPDWSALSDQPGLADTLAAIDGMTRKPVIFEGHVHEDTSTVMRNNSLFVNGKGDVWTSVGDGDTTRQAHTIVTILPNAVYRAGSLQTNIQIEGYGYSGSKSFDSYFIG